MAGTAHDIAAKAEARWAWIVGGIIAFLVAMMAYMSLHWAAMPPVRTETIDPTTLHIAGEFVETKVLIRAGDLLEDQLGIDDAEVVGAEGADADDAEIVVAHHDRIRGAPLVAGEQARVHVVDIGLERRVEAVLPRLQLRQDGDVVGGQGVLARTERVAEFAEIHELHLLRLAHDQLRPVLDRLVVVRKPERQGIA